MKNPNTDDILIITFAEQGEPLINKENAAMVNHRINSIVNMKVVSLEIQHRIT